MKLLGLRGLFLPGVLSEVDLAGLSCQGFGGGTPNGSTTLIGSNLVRILE